MLQNLALLLLLLGYVYVTITDIKSRIIPDRAVLTMLIPAAVLAYQIGIKTALIAAITGGLFFFIMAVLSKGGVGGGDIKLVTVTGLALGPGLIITLLITFILGMAGGFIGLIMKRDSYFKAQIPLAPYLTAGVFVNVAIKLLMKGGLS